MERRGEINFLPFSSLDDPSTERDLRFLLGKRSAFAGTVAESHGPAVTATNAVDPADIKISFQRDNRFFPASLGFVLLHFASLCSAN